MQRMASDAYVNQNLLSVQKRTDVASLEGGLELGVSTHHWRGSRVRHEHTSPFPLDRGLRLRSI